MEGWVYIAVMTNTTGVVKIGYSTGDPDERVSEWSRGTGVPGTPRVEYAAKVENPSAVERKVHKRLSKVREKHEWFKCDVAEAVAAIHQSAKVLEEDDRVMAREEAERRRKKEERAARKKRKEAERAREEAERAREEAVQAYSQALSKWKEEQPDFGSIIADKIFTVLMFLMCPALGIFVYFIVVGILGNMGVRDNIVEAEILIVGALLGFGLFALIMREGKSEPPKKRPIPEDFGL